MNTPNKLTLLRVILVPVFLLLLYLVPEPYNYFSAVVIFVIAALTDSLDGYLARKNGQVTTFGKFLDPLADKILVISALVYFVGANLASPVAVIIILAREFMVTSLRLVAVSSDGKVIAAGILGKIKTVTQMVSIIAILLLCGLLIMQVLPAAFSVYWTSRILIWICAVVTVLSGLDYLFKNRNSVNTTK